MQIGDIVVGVRTNDDELYNLLGRVLAPRVVEGVEAFPNVSLWFGRRAGRVRDFHVLSAGATPVLRTTSVGRLLRAALHLLEGYRPPPAGLIGCNGWAVVGPNGAVLVTDVFGERFGLTDRELARRSRRLLDVPRPLVDPSTLEVVVPEPALGYDADGLAELDARFPPRRDEAAFGAARTPIEGIVILGLRDEALKQTSPARRVAGLVALTYRWDRPTSATDVRLLRALEAAVPVVRVLGIDQEGLGEALDRLDGAARRGAHRPTS